jgi:gamma-glutamyl phosphate reductase
MDDAPELINQTLKRMRGRVRAIRSYAEESHNTTLSTMADTLEADMSKLATKLLREAGIDDGSGPTEQ